MLFRLALRNVLRQKARTALTLVAITFGVASLVLAGGFVHDIFKQLGEAVIHAQTGHIQVVRSGFIERGARQPDRFLIEAPDKLAAQIRTLDPVQEVAARLNFSGLLNNRRRDLAIIGEGVEPDREAEIGTYIQILDGRALEADDLFGMMVGEGVAQTLNISPGDPLTLLMTTADGAVNTLDFEVVGTFRTFSRDFDARAVRIHLDAARELMFTPEANTLVVLLNETEQTDQALTEIEALLESDLQAHDWRELNDFYSSTVALYERQFGVLQLIILLMVLLSVANSVNMSTFERMREFGTMQALGDRPGQIGRLIVTENLILGVVGSALGIVTGITLALIISSIGIPMPPPPNANVGYTALIQIVPETVVTAFMIGIAASLLASLLPARRVIRTPVVDALRQGG